MNRSPSHSENQKSMKLASSRIPSNRFKPISQTILRVFSYTTETPNPSSSFSNDTLYRKISPVGDPRVSIVPILDQWVNEGNPIQYRQIRDLVLKLKSYKRFRHALDVSQWMSDRRYAVLSPGDVAIRLDLISKVHGLEKAEEYFDNIPKQLKQLQVYGALLKCYAYWKSVEKAEVLMQKMRESDFDITPFIYSVLLNLYVKDGQHEKLDTLMEEMNEKGISHDTFTLNVRLKSYATTADVDGMEKTLDRMEGVHGSVVDYACYHIVAMECIKAGKIYKALQMLKKSEELIIGKKKRIAYESLISMYAGIGRKDDVYRIWNLYKSSEKLYNSAYHCMLISLLKLDDMAGAEKIFQEWESGGSTYDFRFPNMMVCAYCENGLLEKAETLVNIVIKKGNDPHAKTWEHLAAGYIKVERIPEAIEAMKKAILVGPPGWKPNRDTLATCLNYLKERGDCEGIDEFARLLVVPRPFSIDTCENLLNHIYDHDKPESAMVNEMDGDALIDSKDTDQTQKMRLENVN